MENKMVTGNNNLLASMVSMDSDKVTIDGRQLHMYLGVETPYAKWFGRMCEYGFEESRDFNLDKKVQVQNEGNRAVSREIINHQLTIDMAKEIAMLQRSTKGKEARQYFIDIEKKWNDPALLMARALRMADIQLAEAQKKIALMQPKVDFYDAVADTTDLLLIGDVAKLLAYKGLGRNNMFKALRKIGVLNADNIPYQRFVNAGYFKLIESSHNSQYGIKIDITTYVTQRGIDYIRKLREDNKLIGA